MSELVKCPTCGKVECFGNEDGHCLVLSDNNFVNKECPFFKTREQVATEKEYCQNRLAEIRGHKEI